jgi:hypothetical protein
MKFIERLRNAGLFYPLLVAYCLWLISLKNRHTGGMDDFDIFFKAGERLLNGENIYGLPHHYNLKYFYSVLFACVMSAIQSIGINPVKWMWFILNTACLLRVFFLLRTYVLSVSQKPGLVFLILLLITGKLMIVNFSYNQASPLILWTMMEAFHLIVKRRQALAVLVLCMGINIKIMPVILCCYFVFIVRKPIQASLGCILVLLFLVFVPAVFIGWDYNLFLLSEWFKTLNPATGTHIMQTYEPGLMDVSSLITKYLSADVVRDEPQVNIAELPVNALFVIINAVRLVLLFLAAYMAYKIRKPVMGIDHRFIASAAFMALIPICFPHQREYSYMFSMPSLAILIAMIVHTANWKHILVFILLTTVAGMMVWDEFAGRDITYAIRYLRLITLGMTGLFIMYAGLCLKLNKAAKESGSADPVRVPADIRQ